MGQRNKVAVFAEPINNGEDDGFASHARQSFDEIHPDVRPNCCWHRQGKEKACWVQVLGLVALTGGACAHIVLDHSTQVRRGEVTAEALECALDSFVAVIVNGSEESLEEGAPGGM